MFCRHYKHALFSAWFFLVLFANLDPALAQQDDLGILAAQIAEKIQKTKKKKIAVFGFSPAAARVRAQLDKELGDELSARLKEVPTLEVVDREQLVNLGVQQGLPPLGILHPAAALVTGARAGAEIVVIGSIEEKPTSHLNPTSPDYVLSVEIWDVAKAKRIARLKGKIPQTDERRALEPKMITDPQVAGVWSGWGNLTYVHCLHCPSPALTRQARDAKPNTVVQLIVAVGTDGNALSVQVVEKAGFGLDERAVEAVRVWRFHPARGPDGMPVAAWTPLDIHFRIY